jgi:hypothetical protein
VKLTRRDKYLRKKYGITETVYKKMLALFDGNCWICKKKPKKSVLNVDHDHKTGQVRGLLCFFCNKYMIGRRRQEHAYLFVNAAEYLRNITDWRKAK